MASVTMFWKSMGLPSHINLAPGPEPLIRGQLFQTETGLFSYKIQNPSSFPFLLCREIKKEQNKLTDFQKYTRILK
jgi:hypothetical protein